MRHSLLNWLFCPFGLLTNTQLTSVGPISRRILVFKGSVHSSYLQVELELEFFLAGACAVLLTSIYFFLLSLLLHLEVSSFLLPPVPTPPHPHTGMPTDWLHRCLWFPLAFVYGPAFHPGMTLPPLPVWLLHPSIQERPVLGSGVGSL